MEYKKKIKCEIYRDSFQNFKGYNIPRAQLVICDCPYNIGTNFYGSNPMWYEKGNNKNGESKYAKKAAFNSDFNFNLYEMFNFCHKMLKRDDTKPVPRGRSSNSPCMIVFCSFEQIQTLISAATKHGFIHYIPLVFIKNYSPQVLKANMRVVGATEYALLLYRDRLPKFRNGLQIDGNGKNIPGTGHMVFNWFNWERDGKEVPKIHPAQKPVKTLKKLIETFTDEGDIVIDPCVDSETEYFNGCEWKKISEYSDEENVLIFDMNTKEARLEKPQRFLKQRYEKEFVHYSSYGIDIMATPDHNIVNYNTVGNLRKTVFSEIIKDNEEKVMGFRGKVPLTFNLCDNGKKYNEWFLRLMVASQADGCIVKNGRNGKPLKTNRYRLRVHKNRKAERMRYILKNAGVNWNEGKEINKVNGEEYTYFTFSYISPYGTKKFPVELIYAPEEAKKIIIDEIKHWDSNVDKNGYVRYHTTIKENADIIQMIAHSIGMSARITEDTRNEKICYCVTFSKFDRAGLSTTNRFKSGKNVNMKYEYGKDGYCYCFTVSTGAFVVRRNGKIHITGNCCGSGTTLRAAVELGRSAYGFEIDRTFYQRAKDEMLRDCLTNY